jgi:hypothetical protein
MVMGGQHILGLLGVLLVDLAQQKITTNAHAHHTVLELPLKENTPTSYKMFYFCMTLLSHTMPIQL